jgi:hypothetical protein
MYLQRLCVIVALMAVLSGCETLYQPEDDYGGLPHGGYVDERIDANTVVVSFSGNARTPQRTIETYLLYRCAQVTLENGYNYFIIISTTGLPVNIGVQSRRKSVTVADPAKLSSNYYTTDKYTGYHAFSTDMPQYSQTVDSVDPYPHGAVAVIKMFTGIKPNIQQAFNAYDVVAHLGPSTY